jgi:hypothetical protein
LRAARATVGFFSGAVRDFLNMFIFFETGKYVVARVILSAPNSVRVRFFESTRGRLRWRQR